MLALSGAYCPWIHLAGAGSRPPWEKVYRTLAHYLLVVNYEGVEDMVVQGEHVEIMPGAAYVIQPSVLVERLGSRKGNRPAYIHFDVIFNERRIEHRDTHSFEGIEDKQHLLQPGSLEVWGVHLPVKVPRPLLPLFQRTVDPLVARWQTARPHDQLASNYELQGLLQALVQHEVLRTPQANAAVDIETRVRLAEATAHQRMSRPFGVGDFARAAQLGRTQFTRVFKRLRGISPGKALKQMRVDEAERLLLGSSITVEQVGKRVGYPNPTVFIRCFRERHGVTPNEWRKRLRG